MNHNPKITETNIEEKEMLDQLRASADTMTPPDSLKPEAIEHLLETAPQESKVKPLPEKKKRSRFSYATRYGSIAAVFILGVTVLWQSHLRTSTGDDPVALTSLTEAETEETPTVSTSLKSEESAALTAESTAAAAALEETADVPDKILPVSDSAADEGMTASADFSAPASYREIYDRLHAAFAYTDSYTSGQTTDMILYESSSASDMAAPRNGIVTSETRYEAAGGYSQTNLQEAGVDEGDIIKTDGNCIYVLRSDQTFAILSADGATLSLLSSTALQTEGLSSPQIREFYLDGDTASMILDGYETTLNQEADLYDTSTQQVTLLLTYDISDRSQPVYSGCVRQDGYYETSRKTGNYVYLFTSYYPTINDTYEDSHIIPRINNQELQTTEFYLPDHLITQGYLVISSVSLMDPDETINRKVLVSGSDNYYVSTENIYIANTDSSSGSTITELTKFHYQDGVITGTAAGMVEGYLNNSFSMNEYLGSLRVVSTKYDENWEEWNSLYVLDENLHQTGSIENLAKGETIRSARFLGDTGYFVTFRQTDPLFSVDLSDPADPKILGTLKVSGFSSYLHFYGENQLLGIGFDADESTGVVNGLKLSMFDISDPSNVTEISRQIIPGITWCPSIDDYKALLVDPEKNLIGFYCDNRYLVYSFDAEKGFTRELLYDFYEDDLSGQANYDSMRGIYIQNTFYLIGNTFAIPFDLSNDFSKETLFTF